MPRARRGGSATERAAAEGAGRGSTPRARGARAASPTGRMTPHEPAPGFRAYGEFVKDELAAQDQRKASFEQRGLAVITTSGTLVTLLFALSALATKDSQTFALPDAARRWLNGALVFFFLA